MAKIVCDLLLLRADDGVTAIEYALICALVACVVLFSVSALGVNLNGKFSQLATAIDASGSNPSGGGSSGGNNGNGKGGCGVGQKTNGC
jgi:Flp pilus assembly pilin Flp